MKKTDDIYWQNFVHNIKWLRYRYDLSEEKMADIMEICVPLLQEVEKGCMADILCVDVVYKIYDFFGVKPHLLFMKILDDNDCNI